MRRTVVAAFITYLLLLVILSFFLPFSFFFSTLHSYNDLFRLVENSNYQRSQKGKEYFSAIDSKSSMKFYEDHIKEEDILIALGIISTRRTRSSKSHDSFGYLFQSAASIDQIVKNEEALRKSFAFVCNVDLQPKYHKDAQFVSQFMPYVERYGNNSFGIGHNLQIPNSSLLFRDIERHSSLYVKETYDYAFCMNVAAALKPKYVLMVEEDAVPHKDFTFVLNHLLQQHFSESRHRSMAFIKFYFPSKWQGFSFRFTEILDLISFSAIGATLYCLLINSYFRDKCHRYRILRQDFMIGFLISVLSCYILGRQNLNELRRVSPFLYRIQSSEMCCTQAMLYPIHIIPRLTNYMVTEAITAHTDLLIWDFAFIEHLQSYQVEPNLFHHTGLHSSLPMKQKHPEEFIFAE